MYKNIFFAGTNSSRRVLSIYQPGPFKAETRPSCGQRYSFGTNFPLHWRWQRKRTSGRPYWADAIKNARNFSIAVTNTERKKKHCRLVCQSSTSFNLKKAPRKKVFNTQKPKIPDFLAKKKQITNLLNSCSSKCPVSSFLFLLIWFEK